MEQPSPRHASPHQVMSSIVRIAASKSASASCARAAAHRVVADGYPQRCGRIFDGSADGLSDHLGTRAPLGTGHLGVMAGPLLPQLAIGALAATFSAGFMPGAMYPG